MDSRYKKSPNDEFEWYYDYESLASIFEDHIDKNAKISI